MRGLHLACKVPPVWVLGHREPVWLSLQAGGLRPRGWAMLSVFGERQGQGGLEGSLLVDAVVLEDREWRWAGPRQASLRCWPLRATCPVTPNRPALPSPVSPLPSARSRSGPRPCMVMGPWGHGATQQLLRGMSHGPAAGFSQVLSPHRLRGLASGPLADPFASDCAEKVSERGGR